MGIPLAAAPRADLPGPPPGRRRSRREERSPAAGSRSRRRSPQAAGGGRSPLVDQALAAAASALGSARESPSSTQAPTVPSPMGSDHVDCGLRSRAIRRTAPGAFRTLAWPDLRCTLGNRLCAAQCRDRAARPRSVPDPGDDSDPVHDVDRLEDVLGRSPRPTCARCSRNVGSTPVGMYEPTHLAILVDARLLVREDFLQLHLVVHAAEHLGDAHDLARSVAQTRLLHDDVDAPSRSARGWRATAARRPP